MAEKAPGRSRRTGAPAGEPAPAAGGGFLDALGGLLGGSTGPRGGRREGAVEAAAKSAARAIGSQVGREIVRGVLAVSSVESGEGNRIMNRAADDLRPLRGRIPGKPGPLLNAPMARPWGSGGIFGGRKR